MFELLDDVRIAFRVPVDVPIRQEVVPRLDDLFARPVVDPVERTRVRNRHVRSLSGPCQANAVHHSVQRLQRRHDDRDVVLERLPVPREEILVAGSNRDDRPD